MSSAIPVPGELAQPRVPARSGSKRVTGKNVRRLGGHPMLAYTVAEQLNGSVHSINALAQNIAGINEQIVRAKGNGQPGRVPVEAEVEVLRDAHEAHPSLTELL